MIHVPEALTTRYRFFATPIQGRSVQQRVECSYTVDPAMPGPLPSRCPPNEGMILERPT